MAEVLAEYDATLVGGGSRYRAQACGAPTEEGLWEAWIEFLPIDGGTPIRSPRETTQPNRTDAAYWATGLTSVYLEGALDRALKPRHKPAPAAARPFFDSPAPEHIDVPDAPAAGTNAVLDPFSVYEKGEHILRAELNALSAWHLVNIVVAYRLSDKPVSELSLMPADPLVNLIVTGVREQLEGVRRPS